MKFILLGDIHFSDTFIHRKDDVLKAFMAKWDFIRQYASQNKIDAVICTGDVFHYKYPGRTTHALMQFVMQTLRWLPCPFYSNVGNHDISYNDINTLSKQPLGVLFQSGLAKPLTITPQKIGDIEIYGIPYGVDLSQAELPDKELKHRLVVLHTFIDANSGLFYGNERIWAYEELRKFQADVVLNGHDHQAYTTVIRGSTFFVRPGSLFRYARNQVDLNREIGFDVWNTEEECPITRVKIPTRPGADAFHVESKRVLDRVDNNVQGFVAQLGDFKIVKQASLSEDIMNLKLPDDVRKELEVYLESSKS